MAMRQADEIWRGCANALLRQIEIERQNAETSTNSVPMLQKFYATYLEQYTALERCYQLQTHPQKRLVVRQALDAVVSRMVECYQLLVELLRDPFLDMFQICNDGAQLPSNFRVPNPRYAITDRPVLLQRNQLMKNLVERYEVAGLNGSLFDSTHTLANYKAGAGLLKEAEQEQEQKQLTVTEAILVLQRTERGRNARVRASLFRNLEKTRPDAAQQKDVVVNRESAAVQIQRYWRGVLRLRAASQKKQAELVFLGLAKQTLKGRSVLPMVLGKIGKGIVLEQRQLEQKQRGALEKQVEALYKQLYGPNKTVNDVLAIPHQCQLSLTPTAATVDPGTYDPLESLYSLSRQIDRINLLQHPERMAAIQANLPDSALPFAPDSLKQLVLEKAARFLQTDEYQNILAGKHIGAVMEMNRQIYAAEAEGVQEEVELDEAAELKGQLRRRAWAAINQYVRNVQLADEEEPTAVVMYPKAPVEFQTKDEQEMIDAVNQEDARKLEEMKARAKKGKKGKKGKGAKGAKGAKIVDEGNNDELAQKLTPFMTDIVDSTLEFFIHWQRHEDNPGEIYDKEFIKEVIRPRIFRDTFVKVWDEVQNELEQMKANDDLIKKMDKKGKGKKGGKGKKKKGKKGKLEYVPPDPVGPVGDADAETAFAELVKEAVIKAPKPATFDDIITSNSFAAVGSKQTLLLKRQAEVFLGMRKKDLTPEQIAADEAEEKLVKWNPLSTETIRNFLVQTVVIPLSSPCCRRFVPRPTKLLLFGAPGCGKTLFSKAVATSLGALFVDLSPANLLGKWPASEMPYLFSQLKKVIFVNTPCVIYVDEVELILGADKKTGKAKKPKGDDGATPGASMSAEGYPKTADPTMKPERIKKDLVKLLKGVAAEDGIVLLGNATRTLGREKALSAFFDRMIYIPLPDYGARLRLLSGFFSRLGLDQYGLMGVAKDMRCLGEEKLKETDHQELAQNALELIGLQRGVLSGGVGAGKIFDIQALSRATDGFTAGQIEEIVLETVVPRIPSLATRPLDAQEFIPAITKKQPQFDSVIAHDALFGMNKVPQRKPVEEPKKK